MNESLFEPHFSFPSTFQREFQQRLSFKELDFYILSASFSLMYCVGMIHEISSDDLTSNKNNDRQRGERVRKNAGSCFQDAVRA